MMRLIRFACLSLVLAAGLSLSACEPPQRVATPQAPPPAAPGTPVPYKIGKPYKVEGIWYYPKPDYNYRESGIASWYGPGFHGRPTANGEIFDQNALTAAHRTLPLPSMVQVTNLDNGRSIKVRVNDRGPFSNGRIIDLSRRAADLLGFRRHGTAKVRVEILDAESRQLAAIGLGEEAARLAPDSAPMVPVTAAPLSTQTSTAGPDAPTAAPALDLGSSATSAEIKPTSPSPQSPAVPAEVIGTQTAGLPQPDPGPLRPKLAEPVPDGVVTQMPLRPARIFVQAGSFSKIVNADRLRARLSSLGPAQIARVMVEKRRFYRVRFGPMVSVNEADRLLAILFKKGHRDARVVVD
jgi:rare lipoprotein A